MRNYPRRGAALIVALITLMVVMLITAAVLQSLLMGRRQMLLRENEQQAVWLAEAGLNRGALKVQGEPGYAGETFQVAIDESEALHARVEIAVTAEAADRLTRRVTATSTYPTDTIRSVTARRTRELKLRAE